MDLDYAQAKFYELNDQWNLYHKAVRELRGEVTRSFAGIAHVGKTNPPLSILILLEVMEQKEQDLQEKINELLRSIG
jgi:hypothetical protein